MKWIKNFFRKKPAYKSYSAYTSKDAKAKLKESFEKRAENKVKAEEIEAEKLDYKKLELELKKEELEVKRAKLKRDKAIFEAELYNYEDEEDDNEREPEKEPLSGLFEGIIGGMSNELLKTNRGNKGKLSNNQGKSEEDLSEVRTSGKDDEREEVIK